MIKADHKWWASKLFNFYIDRQLKKNFSNFYVVNKPPQIHEDKSLIITPNHFSWWDGFFIDKLSRHMLNKKFHIMMLEHQLERYWFFRFLGAYSIDQEKSKSIIETINYTRQLLNDPANEVVIYPQGKIESFDSPELTIKEGLKLFIGRESKHVNILPIGFKIHYYEEKHPSIIARFGELINADTVVENFDFYKNKFTENIRNLAQDALVSNFHNDLFKK